MLKCGVTAGRAGAPCGCAPAARSGRHSGIAGPTAPRCTAAALRGLPAQRHTCVHRAGGGQKGGRVGGGAGWRKSEKQPRPGKGAQSQRCAHVGAQDRYPLHWHHEDPLLAGGQLQPEVLGDAGEGGALIRGREEAPPRALELPPLASRRAPTSSSLASVSRPWVTSPNTV